ncbi:MAG: hypothetical protein CO128_06880, partial [Ignavibacteriales bacterium CG_4_9_14_3_um_filter_30_11]
MLFILESVVTINFSIRYKIYLIMNYNSVAKIFKIFSLIIYLNLAFYLLISQDINENIIYPKKFIGNEFFAEGRYIKCFYKTFYIAG